MAGCVGSEGPDPQCTFLSISSREPKVRPHHLLFGNKYSSSGNDRPPSVVVHMFTGQLLLSLILSYRKCWRWEGLGFQAVVAAVTQQVFTVYK